MITKNNIQHIAMRVNNGSGVLIHLSSGDFVVTARHCINKEDKQSNKVNNFNGTVDYEVENMFFHENETAHDVVLVKLKNSTPVVISKISIDVSVDDKVRAYGFPDKGDQDGMPLSGKVLKWHETTSIETEQPYSGSIVDDTKAISNISGWSGSGLYKEEGDNLYLIGILAHLTDMEHTYKSIHCVSINSILEVINFNTLGNFKLDKKVELRNVLFNAYSDLCEPYYLKRNEDDEFIKNLNVNNLWVFGKSGNGKTALINRNLLFNKLDYLFCDLSPITITSEDDIFKEILTSAEDKFEIQQCLNETNKIKSIAKLLNSATVSDIVIVIDEMSIDDDVLFTKVADSLVRLVTHYTNTGNKNALKFVISTRIEPKKIVTDGSKAMDFFQFICCDDWEDYLEKLFDSLCEALELCIESNSKTHIINSSNGSPRILKKILKNLLLCQSLENDTIKEVVNKSLEESV